MGKAALALIFIAILTGSAACKHTIRDSGCITRYAGLDLSSNLKPGQSDTIRQLFAANNLSTDGLEFLSYWSNTVKDSAGDWLGQTTTAQVYINGLPVFYATYYWAFRNGVFYPLYYANARPQYAWPGNDTTGHQTLPQLRKRFFDTYEAALYLANRRYYNDPHLARPGSYYHDSCLTAQLGYVDTYYKPGVNSPYGTKLVKAWRVTTGTPSFTPYYVFSGPLVFVEDSTGFAWCANAYYPGLPVPMPLLQ